VIVRPRRDDDLSSCVALATLVHAEDDYPPRMADDLSAFISSPDAIAAWVAEIDGAIVGHVALHRRTSDEAMVLAAAASGRPVSDLTVVARLLVSPPARRRGVARSLLATAVHAARNRGLRPMLDVATRLEPAIRLYEANGWRRIGTVTLQFWSEDPLEEFVYLAPETGR
jgi:GNAT superfamily N-acetyltransferase